LFAQGAGNFFSEAVINFSSIIPITVMDYSAAKLARANGSLNVMASNDIQNIAQPPKNKQY
jgi:hypothetical protein